MSYCFHSCPVRHYDIATDLRPVLGGSAVEIFGQIYEIFPIPPSFHNHFFIFLNFSPIIFVSLPQILTHNLYEEALSLPHIRSSPPRTALFRQGSQPRHVSLQLCRHLNQRPRYHPFYHRPCYHHPHRNPPSPLPHSRPQAIYLPYRCISSL